MRSDKSKSQILNEGFNLFLVNPVPKEMLLRFMSDTDGETGKIRTKLEKQLSN